MAKQSEGGKLTAAEATRQTWKEFGKNASGVDVTKAVKDRYGYTIPSSTLSIAKKAVFGGKGRMKVKGKGKKVVAGGLPVQLKSKTEVVRELMATGLSSPTEIAAAAKKLGVTVAPNYVSMIKTNGKKAGGKKKVAGKRKMVRASGSVAVAAARATGAASDLELENAALKLALKAGSVEAAIRALGRL